MPAALRAKQRNLLVLRPKRKLSLAIIGEKTT
jgi:hypothetical protein